MLLVLLPFAIISFISFLFISPLIIMVSFLMPTEEPGRLQSMGLQRVGHDCVTSLIHSLCQFWGSFVLLFPVILGMLLLLLLLLLLSRFSRIRLCVTP